MRARNASANSLPAAPAPIMARSAVILSIFGRLCRKPAIGLTRRAFSCAPVIFDVSGTAPVLTDITS